MVFENGVKNIQAAAYNGMRMVFFFQQRIKFFVPEASEALQKCEGMILKKTRLFR